MPRVVSKAEEQEIIMDNRHKELTNALKSITQTLLNKKDDGILESLEKQTVAIKGFTEAIKSLPEPQIEGPIKKMGDDILKSLDMVKGLLIAYNTPKEWEFKVHRQQYSHLIESVTATETIKKPKYQA